MRRLSAATARVLDRAYEFEPRTASLAAGRSLLAVAQLTLLLADPDRLLFARDHGLPYAPGCGGLRGISLWCVSNQSPTMVRADRVIAVSVLLLVLSGYRPRWTCLPHWYVSFSLSTSVIAPIGGDQVAQIAGMLLVPILLGDRRTWQWVAPAAHMAPRWRGGAYAAHLALRCQVAIIYLVASGAKVLSPTWRRGTAMRVVFQNPDFGVPPQLLSAFRPLFQSYALSAAVGWSVIAIELGIAASMFGPRRVRVRGLILAVLLHAGIILVMGLFGFGLTMIGTVALTCSVGALRPRLGRRGAPPPGDVPVAAHEAERERDKSSSTSASTVAMVAVVV